MPAVRHVLGHLPHQLLIVQGQWGLPAEDVHLALEDRHLHLPFHVLLRLGDAVADIFTLGAVPESYGEEKVRDLESMGGTGVQEGHSGTRPSWPGSALFTAEFWYHVCL